MPHLTTEELEYIKLALYHEPPGGCWALGQPGKPTSDALVEALVRCPGCTAINVIDDAIRRTVAEFSTRGCIEPPKAEGGKQDALETVSASTTWMTRR